MDTSDVSDVSPFSGRGSVDTFSVVAGSGDGSVGGAVGDNQNLGVGCGGDDIEYRALRSNTNVKLYHGKTAYD